jgi:hypothetical protein
MNIVFFYLVLVLAILTIVACYIRTSKQLILMLAFQASIVTIASLTLALIEASTAWNITSAIKALAAIGEWFFAAVFTPLILYAGVRKTQNVSDFPRMGIHVTSGVILVLIVAQSLLWIWIWPAVPEDLVLFAPITLVLSIDVVLMLTREDPFKILAGVNLAETALFPFFEQAPLSIIFPLLLLVGLVNLAGVYIIIHGYREYGVISVTEWRRLI